MMTVLFGLCCLVCAVWSVLFGLCCLVCAVWSVLFGLCCLVCAVWSVLFGLCCLVWQQADSRRRAEQEAEPQKQKTLTSSGEAV